MINLGAGLALLVGLNSLGRGCARHPRLYTAFGVHLRVGDPANMFHFYKNLPWRADCSTCWFCAP